MFEDQTKLPPVSDQGMTMDPRPTDAKRRSFYIGEHLARLLASGRVRARSESARLDDLAARYDILIRELSPRRLELTPAELVLVANIVREETLTGPDLALLLPAKIQLLGTDSPTIAGVDTSALGYRLRTAKHGEVLALIDLAERLLAEHPDPTREEAAAFLDALRAPVTHWSQSAGHS